MNIQLNVKSYYNQRSATPAVKFGCRRTEQISVRKARGQVKSLLNNFAILPEEERYYFSDKISNILKSTLAPKRKCQKM